MHRHLLIVAHATEVEHTRADDNSEYPRACISQSDGENLKDTLKKQQRSEVLRNKESPSR
jgi:hypothetical protein